MPEELSVTFVEVQPQNIEQLRALNIGLFPVKYQDRVYSDILASGAVSQLAYYNQELVGAIACRLELHGDDAKLYIITLGVLAPYRGMRVGSQLLAKALQEAEQDGNIKEAYLHVQSNNHEAMEFYAKSGFDIGETIHNYYRRINPPDAVILRRVLAMCCGVGGGFSVLQE